MNPKDILNKLVDKLFFRISEVKSSKCTLGRIYRKPQENLTLWDICEYYSCKTILLHSDYKSWLSAQPLSIHQSPNPKKEHYLSKIRKSAEQSELLVSRLNLYGPDSRVYDCPRH